MILKKLHTTCVSHEKGFVINHKINMKNYYGILFLRLHNQEIPGRSLYPLRQSQSPTTLANPSFATTITLDPSAITTSSMISTISTTSVLCGSCTASSLRCATARRIVVFVLRYTTNRRGVLTTLIYTSSCYWVVSFSPGCATTRLGV